MRNLHIDIETYSGADIRTGGKHKYAEDIDFEILMIAYKFDDQEQYKIVDLAQGESMPYELSSSLCDPDVRKFAHNAAFEVACFRQAGWSKIDDSQWYCTAIMAAYCGLPLSLANLSEALGLGDKGKDRKGKALIRYWCLPCKPTKANGQRHRNLPHHDIEKWELFKGYCLQDVIAECAAYDIIKKYKIPAFERRNYLLDQKINNRGILMDLEFATTAYSMDLLRKDEIKQEIKDITGLSNPNSIPASKKWLSDRLGYDIKTLDKAAIVDLLVGTEDETALRFLRLRQMLGKTSTSKFPAMIKAACDDNRGRGLFQFYGAYRTGRWAGRLIQLQNLPQNKLKDLDVARQLVVDNDYDMFTAFYPEVTSTLSQLIRTAFIAPEGKTFLVADFSAIEARVIAWIAGEEWRLEVFNTHGMIYEKSASMMFNLPIEECTKEANNGMRAKGKVAELALGYQGAVGALKAMGGEKMGLSVQEMRGIVKKWRAANPKIKQLWRDIELLAQYTIRKGVDYLHPSGLFGFTYDGTALAMVLPSGRRLHYWGAEMFEKTTYGADGEPWCRLAIRYRGVNPHTKKWGWVDTYGGKLTENLVQAVARDLLCYSMRKLDHHNYDIVMHVHDECVIEAPVKGADEQLKIVESLMGEGPKWSKGLPLAADGYVTPYYKKD